MWIFDVLNMRVFEGANGAGKTTTFRMLINNLNPTSGEIIINGRNINTMVWFYHRRIVMSDLYLFEETRFGRWFLSTIWLAYRESLSDWNFEFICTVSRWFLSSTVNEILLYRLKGLKWSEIPQICDDMLELFGLEAYRKRRVVKLRYVVFETIRQFCKGL